MERPILFIHYGNPDYLKLSILKAREFNPDIPIILLGDESNRILTKEISGLEHIPICLDGDAKRLQTIYKHRSSLSAEYELFCMQRWILVRDLMKSRGLKRSLHLDSDVLLFSDIRKSGKRFDSCLMSLSPWGSENSLSRIGHTNFINSFDVVQEFCDFLLEFYTSKNLDERIGEILSEDSYQHISDMTFLGLFKRKRPASFADITNVVDDSTFDDSVHCPHDYEKYFFHPMIKKNLKNILFRDGIPYGRKREEKRREEKRREVRFHSLHCHGATKFLIKHYFEGKPIKYFGGLLMERCGAKLIGLINKYRKTNGLVSNNPSQ